MAYRYAANQSQMSAIDPGKTLSEIAVHIFGCFGNVGSDKWRSYHHSRINSVLVPRLNYNHSISRVLPNKIFHLLVVSPFAILSKGRF